MARLAAPIIVSDAPEVRADGPADRKLFSGYLSDEQGCQQAQYKPLRKTLNGGFDEKNAIPR
jgi:hypothetical protein